MGTNVYPRAAERNGSIKSLRARGGRRFKRLFFFFSRFVFRVPALPRVVGGGSNSDSGVSPSVPTRSRRAAFPGARGESARGADGAYGGRTSRLFFSESQLYPLLWRPRYACFACWKVAGVAWGPKIVETPPGWGAGTRHPVALL
jgi:hypothetical protein